MGTTGSTRKVSFILDEKERVRIMRDGQRFRGAMQKRRELGLEKQHALQATAVPSDLEQTQDGDILPDKKDTKADSLEEPQRKEEVAQEKLSKAVEQERAPIPEEPPRDDALAKHLEKKEAEQKLQESFYNEQIALLERKNLDKYKITGEQFQETADALEARMKVCGTEPVCREQQARLLNCYRDNTNQTLLCSDLAKEYLQCISTAKKELLVNHG